MTPQQRADEWLATWRWLRGLGYTPVERDRLIDRALVEVYAGRVDTICQILRSAHGDHVLDTQPGM